MEKTILIVDDSASFRRVEVMTLSAAGYGVIEACDGVDALNKLNTLNIDKLHLIICDVNMPNMGGIEFVTRVKQNPKYKFTPVMMLTTEDSDEVKQQGRAAGAKAWMVKPFTSEKILNAVNKLIL
ncbi:MAG: response regulator [Methylovulum sp.]|jgi:two-component system chemotaxis response regulator CheY|nr:response regulator [Methylovulum sp.]MCF7997931.1 response regulator [Methylovulum sp.]